MVQTFDHVSLHSYLSKPRIPSFAGERTS